MGAPIGNKNAAGPHRRSSFKNVGLKMKSRMARIRSNAFLYRQRIKIRKLNKSLSSTTNRLLR